MKNDAKSDSAMEFVNRLDVVWKVTGVPQLHCAL